MPTTRQQFTDREKAMATAQRHEEAFEREGLTWAIDPRLYIVRSVTET
jgi:hypothetical protein